MTRTQDAAVAFAFGALAGGVAALLLAPEKGEVTRKRLKEGAKGLIEHGETFACEVRGAAEGALKTATGTVRRQAEAVRGAVAEGAKVYREELDRAHA
ncbi:MAG: YtxH domain-containing protein [Candidatus Omnitrophota bacterium]|nr:YtxH domain-containing protein [Candidatus Omnitrophota bacterium]